MSRESSPKVTADHLNRKAYLYVRQSTPRQVLENTESTKRQYALRQRAVALGWLEARLVVIDSDQGISGASAADREGFKKLVAEVSMGQAGIVMGLEVSRLARNSSDWHRLLEICAFTHTLILDEDGIYDPTDFNDRLLLGLKGTMSEAELHIIQARLRGGIINKAKRGEFQVKLPVGFVYDEQREVQIDPDSQVRDTIRLFFDTFRRIGTAYGVVRHFRDEKIPFPRGEAKWAERCETGWGVLNLGTTLAILHNPRYAGAYCFGRRRVRKRLDGGMVARELPQEEWTSFIRDAHEGYVSWGEFEANVRRLQSNIQTPGDAYCITPAREGSGLLQGMVVCGWCGKQMKTLYHKRGELKADYVCRNHDPSRTPIVCQSMIGTAIDEAVGNLVVDAVTPLSLEVSLAVQDELVSRIEEAERLRRRQVERFQYEADLARRRFMRVDPENRLVADTLEAEWNKKLSVLAEAGEAYERQRLADRLILDRQQRSEVMALATDFPRLWNDPSTPMRERKRMLRLLVEDVTLLKKDKEITIHIRFKGGDTRSIVIPAPLRLWETKPTSQEVLKEIDRLLEDHYEHEVAIMLNERGFKSSSGKPFSVSMIKGTSHNHGIKTHRQRLQERGMLSLTEMAERFGVSIDVLKDRRRDGLIKGHPFNEKGECLYEPPAEITTTRTRGGKRN
ncbi:MAG: recombinase family protein [Armatimonadota bacterium]